MNTQEIANQLVAHCRTGRYDLAHDELYADNCVSIEPKGAQVEFVEGMAAIKQKGAQWASMVEEMHSAAVSEPVVSGNFFSCTMENDVTFKGAGRMTMKEVCVFEVKEGKVVKEQFFYDVAPN